MGLAEILATKAGFFSAVNLAEKTFLFMLNKYYVVETDACRKSLLHPGLSLTRMYCLRLLFITIAAARHNNTYKSKLVASGRGTKLTLVSLFAM